MPAPKQQPVRRVERQIDANAGLIFLETFEGIGRMRLLEVAASRLLYAMCTATHGAGPG
jgi:hypothetical protein